jgi:uncharacterized protein (TIRG00374 family)
MGLKPVWIIAAVAGLAIYAATAIFADRAALSAGIAALGTAGVLAVLALSLGNYLLRFWRWDWYLRERGYRIPLVQHFLYYIAGFALTVTPGKAGEAVRSLYLKQHGVPYPHSLAVLFVERVLDFIAILILAGTFLIGAAEYRPLGIGAGILVIAALALVSSGHMTRLMQAIGGRLRGKLQAMFGHFAEMFESSRHMLLPRRLYVALLIGLVAWGMEGYGLHLLAHALDIDVTLDRSVAIYSTAVLAGALAFFLPGGVGGAEIVMTALLVHSGAPLSVALVVTVLCRVATLWFAVVLGLIAMVILQRRAQPEAV